MSDKDETDLRPVTDEDIRTVEAILFAAEETLDAPNIADKLAANADIPRIMEAIAEKYAQSGFNLQKTGKKWSFRTAPDLAHALQKHVVQQRRLSRAAMEAAPGNIAFCPYAVFLYETPDAPGKVTVGYRRLAETGSDASKKALADVNALLAEIVAEAAGE